MATEFKLPEVGEGIESGTVVGVLVSTGDSIEVDQPVLELETDKAVVEVPSSVAGVVKEIKVKENEEAKVGQVILTVEEGEGAPAEAEEEQEADKGKDEADTGKEEQEAAAHEASEQDSKKDSEEEKDDAKDPERSEARSQQASSTPSDASGGSLPAAPSVRRLARELGVNLGDIEGSGILGRISAQDVRRVAEGGAPAAQPDAAAPAPQPLPDFSKYGEVTREPMSGIRKATVRSMTNAWSTVPMVTHFDKADIGELEKLRKRYQPRAEAVGAKITPTAMLLKVVAVALQKFPKFNASLDLQNNEVVYKRYIHIGVAVDTERGLLVPVIRDVDKKGILELAAELGELAEKARDRKLGPEDMQGGNFSISNLGGIGGVGFTPIVNPPDVAILGVSRGGFEPVYNRDTGEFEAKLMMPLSVTYDHRLIDGANAARFMRFICEAIEDPFLMALGG